MPAVVDEQKCDGCGDCVEACGVGAITLESDVAKIDEEICNECDVCVGACPERAISKT